MLKIEIGPSTELHIGQNLPNRLLELCDNRRTVLVVDEAIQELYGADLAKRIGAALIPIPSGERAKSRETVAYLIDELSKMGCGRDTLLVALGGGATTDLVGFAASIYMRGVDLILIPTTLLAIVDAAIGGKTAIDTPHGKNLIGTLHHPKAIFSSLHFLQTLPEKEQLNGLAEILKMGLIYDPTILEVEKGPDLILKAIRGKISIVEQDPTERGLRRILNFGHTIGHALETVAGYEMPHGEAVALGCLAESYLSVQLGYLPEKEFGQIEKIYRTFPLQLPKGYERGKFLEAMSQDKKKAAGKIRFVLIDRIGHALPFEGAYCRSVVPQELESTLDWMEKLYR